ncbi:hypothetical protein N0V85_008032 [Neurospora sp. IMI 360204]|nr:hypothetical protein N0V85_008032 [Neurospora sp. IMI 360204]
MSSTALESLKASVEQIILDPKYRDVLAIVKGARNGAVYGAKVRFPHALVFFAGLLGGYVVFGQRSRKGKISSVNQQIVVYVFARVVLALARLAVKPGYGLPGVSEPNNSTAISHYAWPVFAAVSWASVMHLFRWHDAELQPSLRSSMVYIYRDADTWDGLRNFLWHNK